MTTRDRTAKAWGVTRFALAALLVIAAGLKGVRPSSPMPPSSSLEMLLQLAVVNAELLLATWLIIGRRPRLLWWVTVVTFSAFCVVAATRAIKGDGSCGCFGAVTVSPWLTAVADASIVAWLIIVARPDDSLPEAKRSRWTFPRVAAACVGSAALGTGWVLTRGTTGHDGVEPVGPGLIATSGGILLEPHRWAGNPWPLLRYVDRSAELGHGRWQVLLVREGCDLCHDAIRRYGRGDLAHGSPLAVVVVPPRPGGSAKPIQQSSFTRAGRGATTLYASLSSDVEWFTTTPVAITLSEGVVVDVREGS